jgi:hypothetical protein
LGCDDDEYGDYYLDIGDKSWFDLCWNNLDLNDIFSRSSFIEWSEVRNYDEYILFLEEE